MVSAEGEHWHTLIHNGVAFPEPYKPKGLRVRFKGEEIELSPLAEEMAYALAKKKGTRYFSDPVFLENFMKDFRAQVPELKDANFEDVDFSEFFELVEEEKLRKEALTKEERKRLARERKERREALKAIYGYAILDGRRVEVANWMVEPPGLFMGRGEHPLRGRWKPRITHEDVVINLSEGAPIPDGNWKAVVHDRTGMWIAKWRDKLTGKMKYVWLHESSPLRQKRDRLKFEKARRLEKRIDRVRRLIEKGLRARDRKTRMVATVCYLIDKLCVRVGDEKDENEADTVGATTLRVEHVKFDGGSIKFDFLGKDGVRWMKEIPIGDADPNFIRNLKEFMSGKDAGDQIFDGINSKRVNEFLSKGMKGLTAKVFRTYHATKVVKEYLDGLDLDDGEEEFVKLYHVKMANLLAAIKCNHKKAVPKNFEERLEKKLRRLEELEAKLKEVKRERSLNSIKRRIRKLKLQIDLMLKTKEYNLGTSLKNYIDPRVLVAWAYRVGLNPEKIYPKSLRRKFKWAFRRPVLAKTRTSDL